MNVFITLRTPLRVYDSGPELTFDDNTSCIVVQAYL